MPLLSLFLLPLPVPIPAPNRLFGELLKTAPGTKQIDPSVAWGRGIGSARGRHLPQRCGRMRLRAEPVGSGRNGPWGLQPDHQLSRAGEQYSVLSFSPAFSKRSWRQYLTVTAASTLLLPLTGDQACWFGGDCQHLSSQHTVIPRLALWARKGEEGQRSQLQGDVLPCCAAGTPAKLRGREKHWPLHRGLGWPSMSFWMWQNSFLL